MWRQHFLLSAREEQKQLFSLVLSRLDQLPRFEKARYYLFRDRNEAAGILPVVTPSLKTTR